MPRNLDSRTWLRHAPRAAPATVAVPEPADTDPEPAASLSASFRSSGPSASIMSTSRSRARHSRRRRHQPPPGRFKSRSLRIWSTMALICVSCSGVHACPEPPASACAASLASPGPVAAQLLHGPPERRFRRRRGVVVSRHAPPSSHRTRSMPAVPLPGQSNGQVYWGPRSASPGAAAVRRERRRTTSGGRRETAAGMKNSPVMPSPVTAALSRPTDTDGPSTKATPQNTS